MEKREDPEASPRWKFYAARMIGRILNGICKGQHVQRITIERAGPRSNRYEVSISNGIAVVVKESITI